jgi:hypothetical protein
MIARAYIQKSPIESGGVVAAVAAGDESKQAPPR